MSGDGGGRVMVVSCCLFELHDERWAESVALSRPCVLQCGRRHVPGPHAARPGHCIARAIVKLQFAEKLFI